MAVLTLPALALSSCGAAKTDKATTRSQDPARPALNVAGITIGMAGAEVAPALEAGGYVAKVVSSNGQPWRYQVAKKVAALSRPIGVESDFSQNEPEQVEGTKQNERVTVQLVTTPDGPRVGSVAYRGRRPATTAADNLADLTAKYGKPSVDYHGSVLWCSSGESRCEMSMTELPSILYSVNPGDLWVGLAPGQRMNRDLTARMQADVAAKVAKPGRSF